MSSLIFTFLSTPFVLLSSLCSVSFQTFTFVDTKFAFMLRWRKKDRYMFTFVIMIYSQ